MLCLLLIITYFVWAIKIPKYILHSFGTDFFWGSDSNKPVCNAEDLGSVLELGRLPAEGNGYPLQYSCLENPMDRGAWQATVHGITKSRT